MLIIIFKTTAMIILILKTLLKFNDYEEENKNF